MATVSNLVGLHVARLTSQYPGGRLQLHNVQCVRACVCVCVRVCVCVCVRVC